MSVSAAAFSRFGANQRLPYQPRRSSRTCVSATTKGSTLSGTMGDRTALCGMIFGDPQNSQFWATRPGSNSVIALQLWHCTETRSASQPFFSSGTARSAATRSCSLMTLPSAASSIGDTAPQYGQTRACCAAFQLAIAPQAGQECLSRAATSDIGGIGGLRRGARLTAVLVG